MTGVQTCALPIFQKSLVAPTVRYVVQRLAVGSNNTERGLFDALRSQLALVPARELERRRRAAEQDDAALDTTHPPTAYRMQFLAAHPDIRTPVACPPERMAAIRAELRALEPAMSVRLVDRYRTSLSR